MSVRIASVRDPQISDPLTHDPLNTITQFLCNKLLMITHSGCMRHKIFMTIYTTGYDQLLTSK